MATRWRARARKWTYSKDPQTNIMLCFRPMEQLIKNGTSKGEDVFSCYLGPSKILGMVDLHFESLSDSIFLHLHSLSSAGSQLTFYMLPHLQRRHLRWRHPWTNCQLSTWSLSEQKLGGKEPLLWSCIRNIACLYFSASPKFHSFRCLLRAWLVWHGLSKNWDVFVVL